MKFLYVSTASYKTLQKFIKNIEFFFKMTACFFFFQVNQNAELKSFSKLGFTNILKYTSSFRALISILAEKNNVILKHHIKSLDFMNENTTFSLKK